ncbi:MAG: helix-turn-helix transcriptional regulator [Planctomycetota bacterium]
MEDRAQNGLNALGIATDITEAVCQLPAVATLDWGDEAADCVSLLASPSCACVLIGTIDSNGHLVGHEATGVAVNGSASDTARSLELSLRSRAERLNDTGLRLGETELRSGVTQRLSVLLGEEQWRNTGIGQLWSDAPVREVLLGVQGLGNVETGRVLIAMVGTGLSSDLPLHEQQAVLSVTLPLLVRRALIAIGARRTTSARWLTQREQQVLRELTLGKSVRQIAEDMGRSPHTIHDHVKSLHRKLNASSRGELVARALGFVDENAKVRERTRGATERAIPEVTTTEAARSFTGGTPASIGINTGTPTGGTTPNNLGGAGERPRATPIPRNDTASGMRIGQPVASPIDRSIGQRSDVVGG